ncbi:MAG: A/G-specific adenine glycosylase [Oscillochloridaceae bacterium umkhey_bin13]
MLAWFADQARDLPWRHTRDPYRILVAEVMLQQTQVDRVLPKYAAFLDAFPSLDDLAAAPRAEVIRLWAGLGYNRRAVNLQRAAQAVRDQHGGVFPQDVALLQTLPGVGPYTAGAIACFAFEQPVAFLDTNIRRVVRRALVGPETAPPPTSDRQLLSLVAPLIPEDRAWAWNQAIMELGALICTAAAPACRRCPLKAHCQSYALWVVEDTEAVLAMAGDQPVARPLRRAAERGPGYRPEAPFVGSNRWYRGRVVAVMRELSGDVTLPFAALGPLVRDGYTPADEAWLRELVAGLARDGLVVIVAAGVRLP